MTPDPPRLSEPALSDLTAATADAALDPDGTDGQHIAGTDLDGLRRNDVTYRETAFVNASANGARFTNCRFLDVQFDALDTSNLEAGGSVWRDATIVRSRLGTIGLYDAHISGMRVSNSKIGLLGLQSAEASDVVVEHCTIEELDISEATLTRVAFVDTAIGELRTAGATLHHVDLREARLGTVQPVAGLRGATLSVEQLLDLAPELARAMGILID